MAVNPPKEAKMDNDRVSLTVDQAAKALRISRGLCYQMVHEGKIPSIRFGKRYLVPQAALERLLTSYERRDSNTEDSLPQRLREDDRP